MNWLKHECTFSGVTREFPFKLKSESILIQLSWVKPKYDRHFSKLNVLRKASTNKDDDSYTGSQMVVQLKQLTKVLIAPPLIDLGFLGKVDR